MSLGGRPKEEGGHKDWHLTFDKVTSEALEKIRNGGGKASEALEKAFKPIAEKYDPGELSIHIWRYEVYLSQQIIKATEQGKPEDVQGLGALASALKDFRSLCGVPPLNLELLSTGTIPLGIKQFFEHKDMVMKAIAHQDPNDLAKVPQATLNYLKADLPLEVKEGFPELKTLEDKIIRVFNQRAVSWLLTPGYRNYLLKRIALNYVPQVYGKAQELILNGTP